MITKLNFTDRTIKSYAIRKLTPKECFRLMGVRDNVIDTMQSSNAQAAERLPDWKARASQKTWRYLPRSSTSKLATQSWWTCWPTSTSNCSIRSPSLSKHRHSSRSSTTPKTLCPFCHLRKCLTRKRFSLPRFPATILS